jgi:hypothetical protein
VNGAPPANHLVRSKAFAVFILALMLFAAFPGPGVRAQTPYAEKLTAYVAGSNALWFMTFSGVNGSSRLSALESTQGLNWYNVTAIKTTSWVSDYQVFGSEGYNLLPVPFTPSEGVFFTAGSDSYADALSAASALNSYLLADFVSLSNGTGSYSFYSPISFDSIVPSTLLSFLPSGAGGFADAITPSSFDSTASPMVVLEGLKSGTEFTHTLVVGSIQSSALDSTSKPDFLGFFGSSPNYLQASNRSSSSKIQLFFLDGVVSAPSADNATVTSNTSEFSGSYSLTLRPGKLVTALNATVVEQPVQLLATRAVDSGVLHTGDNLSDTVILRNLSPTTPITHLTFSETWWNSSADFRYLSGNYAPPGSLAAGGSATLVPRLQYVGTSPGVYVIPASVVRYSYVVGSQAFVGQAHLNPIRLSLGTDDAVVYAYASTAGASGSAVGGTQAINVTVVNVGSQPASSVAVDGHSVPGGGLAALGGRASVTVNQSALGFLGTNVSQSYRVTYFDTKGNALNATTNIVSTTFSHSGMKVGFPTVVSSASLSFLKGNVSNLTLTFVTSNTGQANVTSFAANYLLPAGLGCGATAGEGISCSGGVLAFAYPVLAQSASETATVKYNISSPMNFILSPLQFRASSAGFNISGMSNGVAAPSGLTLSKSFAPSELFGGMSTEVQVSASNQGPLPFYNATVSTSEDSFDSVLNSGSLSKAASVIAPGSGVSLNYNATTLQTYGNRTAAKVSASFFFGGIQYSIQASGPVVLIYQPVSASIGTTPSSPIEGKAFSLDVTLTNPSGVTVSNVLFTIPIPSGISITQLQNAQVADGTLTVTVGSLGPNQSFNASGSAVAGAGTVIPFDNAKLSFSYNGVNVNGRLPAAGIAIGEDITTRYILPIGLVLVILLATAFYVRRLASPSVQASRQ